MSSVGVARLAEISLVALIAHRPLCTARAPGLLVLHSPVRQMRHLDSAVAPGAIVSRVAPPAIVGGFLSHPPVLGIPVVLVGGRKRARVARFAEWAGVALIADQDVRARLAVLVYPAADVA